jgi:serine/threonine protein kinase
VKLEEVFDAEELVELVFEYMPGGDLVKYMKTNSALNEKQSARLLRQIIEALAYLHEIKIIH